MRTIKSTLPQSVKEDIVYLRSCGSTIMEMVEELRIPKSTIGDFLLTDEFGEMSEEFDSREPQDTTIFFLDVEVSPSVALVFPRWNANIGKDAVLTEPYMLTWAGAYGEGEVFSRKLPDYPMFKHDVQNDFQLILDLRNEIDQASIVIAHNAKFDRGWFNQRCAYWNISPPSPYKLICTVKEVKKAFSLPANSLAACANYFDLPSKLDNSGMPMWKACMEGDLKAFNEMEEYNVGDIATLRELYKVVRPYMIQHPNLGVYKDTDEEVCYKCGSTDLELTDRFSYTNNGKYRLTVCLNCKSFNSSKVNEFGLSKRKSLKRGTV